VMELSSLWGPLITAGIFAATLSSALASLVSAPKIFQAVCKDRLFPYIGYFEKGYGRNDEPRRAYALTFVISMLMCLIGDLNLIAPIISNFYLCAYALINYACFDNSFVHSPGFRPGFRFYNMWVSLFGALLCVNVMFIISWLMALLTFFFFSLLFFYISRRKPDVNWGSSTQAHNYRNALQGVIKLDHTDEHVKNYRPQILVLTGHPAARPSLVDFFYNITKGKSLMMCGYILPVSVYVTILSEN
uniref:Amino acid permease/ SLC12A domain-containing protein n=1 Tax=Acrobeloides nanus TaxID=290746 RepID=A0A914D8R6_9BILA